MRTAIIYLAIALLSITIAGTSCHKVYYDCVCVYLSQNNTIDTTLLAVRARNREKADKGCEDAEIKVTEQNGDELFCKVK